MKTKQIFLILTILFPLLFASVGRADWITATNSGSWEDPSIWDTGTVPGTNDFAEVDAPYNVTVDTNAIVQYVFGSGTVTMAANSTLEIMDPAGANGTYQLAFLDTSAPNNTVLYSNNPFWAKHQDYYNLVFSNMVTTNVIDFYNGYISSQNPAAPMTIAGDMTVVGKIKVQQGDDFTILGNLNLGTNSQWDCSSFNVTVTSNLTIGGLLFDLNGALGSNSFGGNVTINPSATGGWNVSDVTTWSVGGSLTNNGRIAGGLGYGRIAFNGTGTIAGKSFTIPTITVNGTYTIAATIILLTNTPTLNGTLVFDLANTNQIVLRSYPTNHLTLYYSGNLNVINSGATPSSGNSYRFFIATNYDGTFAATSFPSLPPALSWVDNLVANGSIAVTGSLITGSPTLSISRSGGLLTLSWDSATYPGYSVQAQTNSGLGTSWSGTGSGTNSPFNTTINPGSPPVFFRLSNP